VLFNLLWHQIQILVARHCFSTALQYAKILYGKNPADDPLAITLSLDMIALKGKNYQFLVDFYEQFAVSFYLNSNNHPTFQSKRNLDMLPNFLYSTAYAYNCLFEKSGDEMYLYKSTELIHKAYTRFPFVLSQILSELSIDPGPAMSKEAMFQGVDR
jgi:hypothetical protein